MTLKIDLNRCDPLQEILFVLELTIGTSRSRLLIKLSQIGLFQKSIGEKISAKLHYKIDLSNKKFIGFIDFCN